MHSLLVVLVALTALVSTVNAAQVIDLTAPTSNNVLVVNDALKTSQHPYYEQGFSVGYTVNGIQGPEIKLTAGQPYVFRVESLCNHPFYLSTHPSGQNLSEFSTGVEGSNYARTCGGLNFTFTPPASMIGKELYYQCRTHSKMGWKITIVQETFCNKYSRITGLSNEALVSLVVTNAFQQLIDPSNGLLRYFDGTLNKVNYTNPANEAQLNALAGNLVAFFGMALGCTDPTFPPYTGNTDMKAVHKDLPISIFEFEKFNSIVIAVMRGAGVSEPDLQAVGGVLASLSPDICNSQCRNSICDRYSTALNMTNVDLVTYVVVQTFTAAVDVASPLRGYFNGSVPAGSTDFLTDATARQQLVSGLVAFFGAALGCGDDGYPVYNNPRSLRDIHQSMPIGLREFTVFNDALIGVLAAAGVADADRRAVRGVLDSTKPDICNQPDCGNPTGTTGNPSSTSTTTGQPPITPDVTYVVDVVPKTNEHPFFGQGFNQGFRIDGSQGPRITLTAGRFYVFRLTQSCAHPFYISTSDVGIGQGLVKTGVTYPQGDESLGCDNREISFTPTAAQVGQTYYYQCLNHQKMGYIIEVVAAAGTSSTTGVNPTGSAVATTAEPVVEDSAAVAALPSLLLFAALLLLFITLF